MGQCLPRGVGGAVPAERVGGTVAAGRGRWEGCSTWAAMGPAVLDVAVDLVMSRVTCSGSQALEKKQLIAAGKLGKFGRPLEGSTVTASQ